MEAIYSANQHKRLSMRRKNSGAVMYSLLWIARPGISIRHTVSEKPSIGKGHPLIMSEYSPTQNTKQHENDREPLLANMRGHSFFQ